jgi:ABC-type multidrug transport system ATPase subunit
MDEPLSSLDAKLRADLRVELKRIQATLGATLLYVTHDQIEAMTMATHVGVLDQGLTAFGLLDLCRARKQRLKVTICVDQFGGGLDPNARHTRYIVGAVASQRLDFNNFLGRNTKFLDDIGTADRTRLDGILELNLAVDNELHKILV